jgi:D-xylose transport system permease protein
VTTSTAPAPPSVAEQSTLGGRAIQSAARMHRSIPVLITLAIIWGVFYSQSPFYLSFGNLTNLTLQIVTTAILALGVVFVLLVGEIDLSSAALSGVCAAVAGTVVVGQGMPLPVGIAAAVAFGMLVTFVEAQVIAFGVPSLIVTLGGMVILQGALLVVLPEEFVISIAGTPLALLASTTVPAGASYLLAAVGTVVFAGYRLVQHRERTSTGSATSLVRSVVVPSLVAGAGLFGVVFVLSRQRGLPLPVLILAAMLLVAWYWTTQTRYGTHLYAVGGDREAAQRAGIPVRRMVLYSFLVLGACAAVAGMVDASRQLGVSVSSGAGPLMLNAIAAAVVGGTSLFGGRGSVWSALLGALVIGSISNGVQLLGLSTEVQFFATGIVLITAVAVDVVLTRGSVLPGRR